MLRHAGLVRAVKVSKTLESYVVLPQWQEGGELPPHSQLPRNSNAQFTTAEYPTPPIRHAPALQSKLSPFQGDPDRSSLSRPLLTSTKVNTLNRSLFPLTRHPSLIDLPGATYIPRTALSSHQAKTTNGTSAQSSSTHPLFHGNASARLNTGVP